MRNIKGTLGTSVAKVFDLTVASTGNNEKTLKRFGIPYEVIHIHPALMQATILEQHKFHLKLFSIQ